MYRQNLPGYNLCSNWIPPSWKKKKILPHYGNEHAANAGNVKVPRHVDIADVISKDTQGQKEIQTRTDEHSGTAANNFENTHD